MKLKHLTIYVIGLGIIIGGFAITYSALTMVKKPPAVTNEYSSSGAGSGTVTVTNDPTKYQTLIAELARAAEEKKLPKLAQLHQDELVAYELDQDNYSFEVKRWGDFISLFIKRGKDKYAGSINLSLVHEIKLTEGHPPDLEGQLIYYVHFEDDKDKEVFVSSNCNPYPCVDITQPPPDSTHYTVSVYLPSARSKFPMINLQTVPVYYSSINILGGNAATTNSYIVNSYGGSVSAETDTNTDYDYRQNYQGPKIEGVPRDAVDDKIELSGLSVTLYTPAGKGVGVRDAILSEIANGFNPKQGDLK